MRTWVAELHRFRSMSQIEQLTWLSHLLHLITISGRGTYEVGGVGVEKPGELRRFNELIHRVVSFQGKIATSSTNGISDSAIFDLLEHELASLHVDADDLLEYLQ